MNFALYQPGEKIMETCRILIAEDDEALMSAYRALLGREHSFQLDTATCPREAHALIRKHRYDAAVFDIELSDPAENGLDLARDFHASCPDSPVLMVSTRDDETTVRECIAAGAVRFQSKNHDFLRSFARTVKELVA